MLPSRKTGRYHRIFKQLQELTAKSKDPQARMATIDETDAFWLEKIVNLIYHG